MVVICKDSNISPPTIPFLSGIVPKWAKNQKLPRNQPRRFLHFIDFQYIIKSLFFLVPKKSSMPLSAYRACFLKMRPVLRPFIRPYMSINVLKNHF